MIQNLQRIQVKLLSNAPADLSLDPFLEIFSRWRKEKDDPAEWVDLADYAHMAQGPGIVLAGMKANIAFDMEPPRPGFLYTSRKGLAGSNRERIASVFHSCFSYAKRLLAEKQFPTGIEFPMNSLEVRFTDRLQTPNHSETDAGLRPALVQVLNSLFGAGQYQMASRQDAGQAYGFSIAIPKPDKAALLLSSESTARNC